MRFGFVLPRGDARDAAELAAVAEDAGWDGFFVWESVWGVDAWMALAAAAVRTERIRLGTMLTPLPRKRPWELAGQTATLDNLSGGRTILSVGLGAPHEGWLAFEPDPGRRTRAELLDEGLDVLTGLWAGQPFRYEGRHYRVTPTDFVPPPPLVQRPRIPIWVVGGWPAPRSMARAARYDGWLPNLVAKAGEPTGPRPGCRWRATTSSPKAPRATAPPRWSAGGETPALPGGSRRTGASRRARSGSTPTRGSAPGRPGERPVTSMFRERGGTGRSTGRTGAERLGDPPLVAEKGRFSQVPSPVGRLRKGGIGADGAIGWGPGSGATFVRADIYRPASGCALGPRPACPASREMSCAGPGACPALRSARSRGSSVTPPRSHASSRRASKTARWSGSSQLAAAPTNASTTSRAS